MTYTQPLKQQGGHESTINIKVDPPKQTFKNMMRDQLISWGYCKKPGASSINTVYVCLNVSSISILELHPSYFGSNKNKNKLLVDDNLGM